MTMRASYPSCGDGQGSEDCDALLGIVQRPAREAQNENRHRKDRQ